MDSDDLRSMVEIRPLEPHDDLVELTDLIHAAYAELGRMGLNFTGVDQSVETTADRCADGETWVAVDAEGALVGTATMTFPDPYDHCVYYRDLAQVALNQFAVHPTLQRSGIGARLITQIEHRAVELGYRALALDTAIPAQHLYDWYRRQGFEPMGEIQWGSKRYRSVVMRKLLA